MIITVKLSGMINKNEKLLSDIAEGRRSAESACNDLISQLNETDANYIKLIEDKAEFHKVIAKLRTENNELYQESAKDKGL